jgi:phosphate-selective porin OprO/OprP
LEVNTDSTGITGRVTGLPWYQEDGRKLLHLGVGFSYRDIDDDDFNYRRRPESGLAPMYLDTGSFEVNDLFIMNGELAFVYGPFSIQSEYFHSSVQSDSGNDADFGGFYAQASYFITGEHRPYRKVAGVFHKANPNKNLFIGLEHGPGAWEIALRYSHLDLNDAGIAGGDEHNITAALNWYMNPNARIQFNYVYGDIDSPSGQDTFHAIQGRFQIAF